MMKTCLLSLLLFSAGNLFANPAHLRTSAGFHGTSTLHDFDGTGQALPAPAEWTPGQGGGILSAEKIVFEVKNLSTDHKKRDKNMMKMFDPDTFPTITGSVKNWKLGAEHNPLPHTLTLNIHGKTVDVPVRIVTWEAQGKGMHLRCTFTLSLKECGLKRPSVLGLIRVGDDVAVTVDTLILPGPVETE